MLNYGRRFINWLKKVGIMIVRKVWFAIVNGELTLSLKDGTITGQYKGKRMRFNTECNLKVNAAVV